MTVPGGDRRVLLVGGGGGLLGRAVLESFAPSWRVRSLHRHAVARESELGVEWVPADVAALTDWKPVLKDVQAVVNLAWYRWGPESRFRSLYDGLERMRLAASGTGIPVVQVSVPPAPAHLETGLPYLTYKRRFDGAVAAGGAPFAILRPTLMFARGDVLLGSMLRQILRYPVFPMFGDGRSRLSPIAASDVARSIERAASNPPNATWDLGGPVAYRYRALTDRMFALLGKRARYWTLSPSGSRRLAALMQAFGSTLLYEYEVEWLLSDTLALPPSPSLNGPLQRVEPFLRVEAERLVGHVVPDLGPLRSDG
ncbi:MAG: hypothetical protein L3K01_03875 [Thermoplasmata archaeon]|nr:hypothetical protein [Thermoplasmata archaeon]